MRKICIESVPLFWHRCSWITDRLWKSSSLYQMFFLILTHPYLAQYEMPNHRFLEHCQSRQAPYPYHDLITTNLILKARRSNSFMKGQNQKSRTFKIRVPQIWFLHRFACTAFASCLRHSRSEGIRGRKGVMTTSLLVRSLISFIWKLSTVAAVLLNAFHRLRLFNSAALSAVDDRRAQPISRKKRCLYWRQNFI